MTETSVRPSRESARPVNEQDDEELLHTVQSEPVGSTVRDRACEELVRRYRGLVGSCTRRYAGSPEPAEELMQVGYVGLLKAINNFDPSLGQSLVAYATPCITGELKRHFRDKRWQVHVRRAAQELRLDVQRVGSELVQKLARMPTEQEIARYLGISSAELLDAQRADLAFMVNSLDAPLTDGTDTWTLEDQLVEEDAVLDTTLAVEDLWTHISELSEREQRILFLRFYGNMTQSEIAERVGVSQMHVSRLLAHALSYLRGRMTTASDPA
jgi:RNA polymerase sigma-B factor